MDLEIWRNLQWEVQQTWEALKCSQTTLTEPTEPTDSTSSEHQQRISEEIWHNINWHRQFQHQVSTCFNMFQQCSTSTHRHIDSLCPAPGSWNSRSHAGDVWRRRGPWHVPCGVPCCDRLTIDGLWSCNSCATVGSGSSGSSGSFVSACWGCCTACVLSQSWPFRCCHFQRCKDIWKRWRSQTSHDFGHLRTTSTSVWPFGSICPILSIVSILWFRPGRFRCSQPVFSPFSLLVFFAFKSLQHFKMFYNIFQHVFQDVSSLLSYWVVLPPFLQSRSCELSCRPWSKALDPTTGRRIWMDLDGFGQRIECYSTYRCISLL